MGRVYSRTACLSCKRRKKKCDERVPKCDACTRLGLQCSYGPGQSKTTRPTWQLNADILIQESQSLTTTSFTNSVEESIVFRVPQTIRAFFTPASSQYTRELKELWQLMFQDELVRSALVACFSVVLGSSPLHGKLNNAAYSRVIELLRGKLAQNDLERTEKLSMAVAINTLGLLQAMGPERPTDPLQHFKGLLILLSHSSEFDMEKWRTLPRNLFVLLLESLLCHISCLGIFSRDIVWVRMLWRRSRLGQRLEKANPEGPSRLGLSPILNGQYALFDMAMEVTCLHRRQRLLLEDSASEHAGSYLSDMESHLVYLEKRLSTSFSSMGPSLSEYRLAIQESFKIFCSSLHICICTLRRPTESRRKFVDQTVMEALDRFCSLPILCMAYEARLWGFQVLGCAIRHHEDLQRFMACFDRIKMYLTPGHVSRADNLFRAAQSLRERERAAEESSPSVKDEEVDFPVGLFVLRGADVCFEY